jgi:Protein involved in biosynthesis of mitomycin antibiotics/polyketide fumonisin
MILEVEVTRGEVESGRMTPEHRDEAVRALREDGVVVLKDVIDPAHLEVLRERMVADLELLKAREDAPFNWNAGNLQQDPPPFPPYLFRDVLVNEMVIAVTRAVLGPGVKNHFYSGNTAVASPGRERQPVHGDTGHLWPDLTVAHPPALLVVNVPLVDMGPENGSTEIWPGTHLDVTLDAGKDIKVPPEALEARRQERPPLQPRVAHGSVLIRDMRLWHAGMPNLTSEPRPMIAMIHACGWLDVGEPSLRFPVGTEPLFEHPELRTHARFVGGPIDHIAAPHGYEYTR